MVFPQLTNLYRFSQDRPNIFVSFYFTPICCFAKVWSVSFTSSFPFKVETFKCHLGSSKSALWNTSIAIFFKDVTYLKLSPPVIKTSTYRLSFFLAISPGYFTVEVLACLSIFPSNMKGNCIKPNKSLVNLRTSIWLVFSFQT